MYVRYQGIRPCSWQPWYGERLDLDYAIYTCLAGRDRQGDDAPRGRAHVYEPGDWHDRIREHYSGQQATYGPVQIPIPV